MCGSTQRHMFLGGVLAWRQVSMKVLWWLALASMISDAFSFLFFSFRKVWLVCFGSVKLVDVWSSCSSSLSILLVPSILLFKILLRFNAHTDLDSSSISMLSTPWLFTIPDGPGGLALCILFVWLSGVESVIWLTPSWDDGWLEDSYRKFGSCLSTCSLAVN